MDISGIISRLNRSGIVSHVATASVLLAGTVITTIVTQRIAGDEDFFNILEKKYSFGEEYTKLIDNMLMKDSRDGVSGVINELGESVPNFGIHYYYHTKKTEKCFPQKFVRYIRFYKKREFMGDRVVIFYHCYVGRFNDMTYEKIMQHINDIDPELVQTVSIDTSQHVPRLIYCKKICRPAHQKQELAIKHIMTSYDEGKNHNVKVMIYGPRGTGKTYVGRLLKRQFEKKNINAYLFDDFNPASIGVNLQWFALNQASQKTPVIIIIDEINTVYDEVTREKQDFDSRLQYTRNKQSFNNMLDLIGDTKYVIAIYTTESSIEDLNENENHKSFFRPGRVDFFLKMTDNDCSLEKNV